MISNSYRNDRLYMKIGTKNHKVYQIGEICSKGNYPISKTPTGEYPPVISAIVIREFNNYTMNRQPHQAPGRYLY
jgi:hypothetical protein